MSLLYKETTSTIVGKLMVWNPCLCFLRNFWELSVFQVANVNSDFKCIQKTGRPGHPLLPIIFCYFSFLPKSILYRTLDLMVKRQLQSGKDKCDQQASESIGGVPPVLLQCVGSLGWHHCLLKKEHQAMVGTYTSGRSRGKAAW